MIENKDIIQEETEFENLQIITDPGQSPIRIDQFIFDKLSQVSRNKIQNAISAELITVNSKAIKSNYKVRPKDIINIVFPKPQIPEDIIPQNIPLNIHYEDDDILIINSPSRSSDWRRTTHRPHNWAAPTAAMRLSP